MDDNNVNGDKNQPGSAGETPQQIPPQEPQVSTTPQETPQPFFETVPENNTPTSDTTPASNNTNSDRGVQPEEIASDVATPEDALKAAPPPPPVPPPSSMFHSDFFKYFIIGGGVVLFLVIFFILLRFFTGGNNAPKKEITLQYWGLWEEPQVFAPLIAEYQSKNPHIKIEYQKMSHQDYRDKLIVRGKNGQGPDIFRFHNTWLPQLREIATDIPANIMSGSEFEKTFYPIHTKDLKVGRHYYGIPLQIDGLVLVYNDGIFKKAGISKAPVTWEDITEVVAKLYSGKDKDGQLLSSPIALGTASNIEHFSDIFALMLVQNGGDIRRLDQPEASGALESYRKFAEEPTQYWNDAMPNSIAAFIQEKVAMIIVPSWEILVIKAANPDIDLKVTTVPKLPASEPVSIASYWVEGVSKYGKNQIEAWKFLKFLSEKESLTKLYETQSKTRLFGYAYSRVDLTSIVSQNEYLGPVLAQAEYYVSVPMITRTYDNGLNDEISKYIENAVNETVQGGSYSEALRKAAQGVSQVYSRLKIE